MFGEEYIWQAIAQKHSEYQKEHFYKCYITETLRIISENTSHIEGGKFMNVSYKDVIENGNNEPQRSAEEIIASIKKKINEMR